MARRRRIVRIFGKAGLLWQLHSAPRLGAALAFYTVLSLAPLLIVAVGVTSLFLSRAEVQQGILEQVTRALGPESDQVVGVLRSLFKNAFRAYQTSTGIITSAVGLGVLLFGASLVLVELRAAMNIIWGVKAPASRREGILTFLKNRLISVGLVLGSGIFVVGSLSLRTYIAASRAYLQDHQVPVVLLGWLETLSGFILLFLFLVLLYKYLPATRVRWRDTWFGALFTAFLFTIGRWLLGTYIAESALSSAYGAAGSLVVFFAVGLLFGAALFFRCGALPRRS